MLTRFARGVRSSVAVQKALVHAFALFVSPLRHFRNGFSVVFGEPRQRGLFRRWANTSCRVDVPLF